GGRKEIVPVRRTAQHLAAIQPEISLVDQGRGLEGVGSAWGAQEAGGDVAQFVVNQADEPVLRPGVAFLNGMEKPRHLPLRFGGLCPNLAKKGQGFWSRITQVDGDGPAARCQAPFPALRSGFPEARSPLLAGRTGAGTRRRVIDGIRRAAGGNLPV